MTILKSKSKRGTGSTGRFARSHAPADTAHHPRPRRHAPWWARYLLRPLFRYSYTRDAYVLRGVGRKHGPVLRDL